VSKIRVGIVNFLNSKPLAWGFLKGHYSDLFAAGYYPPARVADLLREGSLDIGLIPAIEVQRIPGLTVLPDLCVSATREVRSVLLISKVPPEKIRRVALDLNSRTSAALTRIVLADRYGREPETIQARPDPEAMLAAADAALIIGDPALKVRRDRYHVLDLAAEWRALTGLPCVFAVWAVRPGLAVPNLAFYFKSSLRYGLSSIDILVREAAAELDLDSEQVHTYLTENLSYVLGDEQRSALREYYRRAHAHALIAEPRPLVLWGEEQTAHPS